MSASRPRPSGGRFTEWLEGRPIVAADVLPSRPTDPRQVITAPLPMQPPAGQPAQVTPSPVTAPIQAAPVDTAPARTALGNRAEIVGPKHRPAEIKEHPVADKILEALSSYDRPYLKQEVPETSGHVAASYAAAPVIPPTPLPTPAPEPRTQLTNSLVEEIQTRKARAAEEVVAREVPTVVTKNLPRELPAEDLAPTAVEGVPRRRIAPGTIAALALLVLCIGGAAVIVVARRGEPSPPTATRAADSTDGPLRNVAAPTRATHDPASPTALPAELSPTPSVSSRAATPTTAAASPSPAADLPMPTAKPPAATSSSTRPASSGFPSKSTFQVEN